MMSGLMGTMASGMAFGAGSAVAHQAVGAASNAIFGGGSKESAPAAPAAAAAEAAAPPAAAGACATQQTSFYDCLKATNGDANMCQQYFEAFKSCQEQAKAYA